MKEMMLIVILTLQCIHAQSHEDTYNIDPINFDTYIPFNQQIEHQAQEILHPEIQTIAAISQQKEETQKNPVEEHTVQYWIQRMNHEYPEEFDMQEKDIIFAQTTPVVEEVKQIIDDLVVAASTEQENPGTVNDEDFDQLETTLELVVDKAQVGENFGISFIDVNDVNDEQYEMTSQEKMAFELYTPQQHFRTDNQEDNKLYQAFEQSSKEEFWEEMKKQEDPQVEELESQNQHNQEQQNFYEDIEKYINIDNNPQKTNPQEFENKIKKQNEQNKEEKKQRIEQVKSQIEEELKSNKLKVQGDTFNNEQDYIDWKMGQNQKDIMFMMQSGNLRWRL